MYVMFFLASCRFKFFSLQKCILYRARPEHYQCGDLATDNGAFCYLQIEMGSTNVRVGSTIFGPRDYTKKEANQDLQVCFSGKRKRGFMLIHHEILLIYADLFVGVVKQKKNSTFHMYLQINCGYLVQIYLFLVHQPVFLQIRMVYIDSFTQ